MATERRPRPRRHERATVTDNHPGAQEDISPPAEQLAPSSAPPDVDTLISGATSNADRAAPTALDELADTLNAPAPEPRSSRSSTPAEPPRRKRGRPANVDGPSRAGEPRTTKAELAEENARLREQLDAQRARDEADPEQLAQLAGSISALAHVGFALVAEARGPHWMLTSEERELLGSTGAQAAAPYAEQLQASAPWAAPLLALAGIIGKRVIIDVQQQRAAVARVA